MEMEACKEDALVRLLNNNGLQVVLRDLNIILQNELIPPQELIAFHEPLGRITSCENQESQQTYGNESRVHGWVAPIFDASGDEDKC